MYNISHNFTYRQKDKGWQVILSYKDGGKWRQKSKQGLKTKQLAKAAGEKLLDELQRTFVPTTENEMTDITLREFLPIFLKDKPHLTHSSIYAYSRLPVFFSAVADEPLRKLTAASIRSILVARQGEFSVETLRQRTTLFACVLSHAIHTYGILRENPVTKAGRCIRGKKKHQIRAISKADFEKLMQSKTPKRHEDYKIIALIAYYTGMRYGEILGLSWNDVDFERKQITVRQQLKRHSSGNKHYYKLGALKTQNSYRTIPIPDVLAESLKAWHLKSGLKSVISVNNSGTSPINHWIHKTLPQTTIHDFRHTYATNLLANGLDVQTVAALCGDTVGTIIKTYIDYTSEMRKKAAKDIDRIF